LWSGIAFGSGWASRSLRANEIGEPVDRSYLKVASDAGRAVNQELVGAGIVGVDADTTLGADKELVVGGGEKVEVGASVGPDKSAGVPSLGTRARGESIFCGCVTCAPRNRGEGTCRRVANAAAEEYGRRI
jgi:hypothetical protein